MTIRLYNTLARRVEAFEPGDPNRVTMYVCGPTVYDFAHIGNARPVVIFDMLFRLLRHAYGDDHVIYARNFTDIDDKIMDRAAREGRSIKAVSKDFIAHYIADMGALGTLTPTLMPKATEHLGEMIAMMRTLIDKGHAYVADGHVLFHVPSMDTYGTLSRHSRDELIAGARVDVAPYKRDPADFVLWKPSTDDQPGWGSPFGRGRPGWHLECSCMTAKHLGETIDIHGGGQDLIFPHHENEIAQSECAHGAPMARMWMHNGYLTVDGEKMSKSLGNVQLVHELIKDHPGEVLRYALLTAHYRAPLTWTADLLAKTRRSLDRVYGVLRRLGDIEAAPQDAPAAFVEALHDDLNTPKALSELFQLAGNANKAVSDVEKARAKGELLAAAGLLGLGQADPDAWFGLTDLDPAERAKIDELIIRRQTARVEKDWPTADAVRDELNALNVQVDDGPEGSTWRKLD